MEPALAPNIYPALGNAAPQVPQQIEVYAMRIEARPFGHNAPLQLTAVGGVGTAPTFGEWQIDNPWGIQSSKAETPPPKPGQPAHGNTTLYLDNDYEIDPGSFAIIDSGKMIVLAPGPHGIGTDVRPSTLSRGPSASAAEARKTTGTSVPASVRRRVITKCVRISSRGIPKYAPFSEKYPVKDEATWLAAPWPRDVRFVGTTKLSRSAEPKTGRNGFTGTGPRIMNARNGLASTAARA